MKGVGSSALVLLLMEHIDDVPNLDANEKARMIAEAKCLIAVRYFDMFRHYGGFLALCLF